MAKERESPARGTQRDGRSAAEEQARARGPSRAALLLLVSGMMLAGLGAALSAAMPWAGLAVAAGGGAVCLVGGLRLVRAR
jgi:hypothetical protein